MKLVLVLSLAVFVFNAFASIHERLAGTQLSYYTQEFYQQANQRISKEYLFTILNSHHTFHQGQYDVLSTSCKGPNCYSHVSVGYSQARKILFGDLHVQRDGKGTFVQDVYCAKKFYFRQIDDVSNMGTEVNIEHTWPQSKFTSQFDKEMQKSDLHHLFPTDSEANSRRGNFHFGNVSDRHNELKVHACEISKLGHENGEMIFTPPVQHRGNVARAIFYFSVRYKIPVSASEEAILRQWHDEDPINEEEVKRHERVAELQKVRNPFIDYPQLVNHIQDF